MRVLHILDHSLPLQSGYVFRTLGLLGGQRGIGWETFHLTTPRNHDRPAVIDEVDGWSFYRTPKPQHPLATKPVFREICEMRATKARLDQVIAEIKPDILHAHSPVLTAIPALRAARRAGIPLVYEARALWEDAAVDLGTSRPGSLRYHATRAMETYVFRRADGVATICQSLKSEIASRGIDPNRIAVVPNAVDIAAFGKVRPHDAVLAENLGIKNRTVIGFIGSFYHYEGLDLLLQAVAKLGDRGAGIAVLLVGGGPEDRRLREMAQSLGLASKIIFTGRVPHNDVQRYYDLVDVFCYPRKRIRLTELTTPLKPLEAMAERKLVMASDIGGHRELIRDAVTGYLFPPDDIAALAEKIIYVVKDTGKHPAMREAGRRFVATERNWAVSAENYRSLYAQALEASGGRALPGQAGA
jgi:PEP-CTERM/exosortase A-associated glycosyltransferase